MACQRARYGAVYHLLPLIFTMQPHPNSSPDAKIRPLVEHKVNSLGQCQDAQILARMLKS